MQACLSLLGQNLAVALAVFWFKPRRLVTPPDPRPLLVSNMVDEKVMFSPCTHKLILQRLPWTRRISVALHFALATVAAMMVLCSRHAELFAKADVLPCSPAGEAQVFRQ